MLLVGPFGRAVLRDKLVDPLVGGETRGSYRAPLVARPDDLVEPDAGLQHVREGRVEIEVSAVAADEAQIGVVKDEGVGDAFDGVAQQPAAFAQCGRAFRDPLFQLVARPAQRPFRAHLIGDVAAGAAIAPEPAGLVEDRLSIDRELHDLAVRAMSGVAKISKRPVCGEVGQMLLPGPGVDARYAGFLPGLAQEGFLRNPGYFGEAVREVGEAAALVHLPEPVRGGVGEVPEALLGFAAVALRLLALGDVAGQAAGDLPVAVAQVVDRNLDGKDGAVLAPVPRLEGIGALGLDAVPGLRPIAFVDLRVDVEELQLRYFFGRVSQKAAAGSVHVDEARVGPDPEHGVARVVDGELGQQEEIVHQAGTFGIRTVALVSRQIFNRHHGHGRLAAAFDDDPFPIRGNRPQELGKVRSGLGRTNSPHRIVLEHVRNVLFA